ncbi:MAG TPA: hypothetical protein VFB96_07990, partial [Pirellulaceae bacterium]|nr:hypothetical protein [Pirellulaceae bacterium]
MRLSHLLSQLFHSRDSRGKKPRLAKKPSRRLLLEPLEDRRVLATFLVTNIDDSGPGSLRQAMLDADRAVNQG